MNILFVNTDKCKTLYGVERWMLNLGGALREKGHATAIAARPSSIILEGARKLGTPVLPFNILSGLEIAAAAHLRGFIRHHGSDVVCVKKYKELRVARLATLGLPIPVFARRGAMGDVKNNLRARLTISLCADGLIVPSGALKREFCANPWLREERVHVLHHGVSDKFFEKVAPQPAGERQGARVVYAGRMDLVKGVDILLKAWRAVRTRHPTARLVVVGSESSGGLNPDEGAAEHGIEYIGYQDDVRPWMAGGDLLVLPSRKEGAGQVIIEAMAQGKPVIASRVGGIPEYIEEGKTGLLVEPEDTEGLATALMALIEDSDRRRRMGAAALKRARQAFTLARAADRFVEIVSLDRNRLPKMPCNSDA